MFRTSVIIFAAVSIILGSSLASFGADKLSAKISETDIKANGASFQECVSMAGDLA